MREFYTLSLTICFGMISAEDKPDQQILDRLTYIKNNTHQKIKIPLSVAEVIILTNYSRQIGKTIEFKDNEGKTREYPLWLIIQYAKESYFELAEFVVKIAKKYSLDIPMKPTAGTTIEIPTLPPPDFAEQPVQQPPESPPVPTEPTINPDEPIGNV